LPIDLTSIICEILGEPASRMRNPVNAGYQCPFINSECTKRSHRISGPYPVCSIWRSQKNREVICICPKRLFEADLKKDLIAHCWEGPAPNNPQIAYEVKMADFGTVDFVIADIETSTRQVKNFLSVELQAVDLTGSVETAYNACLNNINPLLEKVSYGINWANVRKRYIAQLITKGFFHHHWGTRIVSVIQTALYNALRKDIQFDELPPNSNCNILFMLYDFKPAPHKGEDAYYLALDRVIGTSHNSLMLGSLYRIPPPKKDFCDKIIERLVNPSL
jgi:hypothetical protein